METASATTTRDYTRTITADIPPAEAADRIARVTDWWTRNTKGSARKPGDTFTVDFGETFVDFKVAELVPGKRIVWEVTNCRLHWIKDKTEWNGTKVAFDISSQGGTTTVRMTHIGLVPEVECFGTCEQGWNFHVGESLQQLLRTDKGLTKD